MTLHTSFHEHMTSIRDELHSDREVSFAIRSTRLRRLEPIAIWTERIKDDGLHWKGPQWLPRTLAFSQVLCAFVAQPSISPSRLLLPYSWPYEGTYMDFASCLHTLRTNVYVAANDHPVSGGTTISYKIWITSMRVLLRVADCVPRPLFFLPVESCDTIKKSS